MISVQDLSFHYPGNDVRVLDHINLEINQGEWIVLAGKSGCGKSTLALAMGGFLFNQYPEQIEGRLIIDGLDARVTPLYEIADRVGLVQQNPEAQFCTLMVEDEVVFGLENRRLALPEIKQRLEWALEITNCGHLRQRPLASLSGGEKQKIAIAMAFANNPTVILADEPSGNIDSVSSENVMNIFKDFIKKNPNKSVVIVTHNPNLRKIADRTLIIKDGQIIRELGKLETGQPGLNSSNDEGLQELEKIIQYHKDKDQVENILDPKIRYLEYKNLKNCPNCKSLNIIKKFDKENGNFKLKNGQLITRASIFCQDCFQLSYKSISLFDVQKNLI
ncbi:MAG: energy-coupling factor ABC transporter ATP-binding protein [Methanosarcinaceae archaeon]|nr:energy-coupling factor ABC transporter ATP-binding protein [Methanosarcinaceae archaeon]